MSIRHGYFNRSPNPDKADEQQIFRHYSFTIDRVSYKVYGKFEPVFKFIGYELDDIKNLARCHVVSFVHLFSIKYNEQKRDEFIKSKNREVTQGDIDRKDMSNFMSFLTQRISELAFLCMKKNQNIIVSQETTYLFRQDGQIDLQDVSALVSNDTKYSKEMCDKLQHTLLSKKDMFAILKENGIVQYKKNDHMMFVGKDGKKYHLVHRIPLTPTEEEYTAGIFDLYSTQYYSDPETNLMNSEQDEYQAMSDSINNANGKKKLDQLVKKYKRKKKVLEALSSDKVQSNIDKNNFQILGDLEYMEGLQQQLES